MFTQEKINLGMYTPRKSIIFGVEMELCVCDKSSQKFKGKGLGEYMHEIFSNRFKASTGIPLSVFEGDFGERSDDYNNWLVMMDKSVDCFETCRPGEPFHGLELISPILEWNEAGTYLLRHVVENLNKDFYFEVNNTQGLHINISYYGQKKDIAFKDLIVIRTFLLAWYHFEPEILSLISEDRHEAIAEFATPLTEQYDDPTSLALSFDKTFSRILEYEEVWPVKYSAINVKKDRFEIRIPGSEPDIEYIIFWVDFCGKFLKACLEGRNYLIYENIFDFIKLN